MSVTARAAAAVSAAPCAPNARGRAYRVAAAPGGADVTHVTGAAATGALPSLPPLLPVLPIGRCGVRPEPLRADGERPGRRRSSARTDAGRRGADAERHLRDAPGRAGGRRQPAAGGGRARGGGPGVGGVGDGRGAAVGIGHPLGRRRLRTQRPPRSTPGGLPVWADRHRPGHRAGGRMRAARLLSARAATPDCTAMPARGATATDAR